MQNYIYVSLIPEALILSQLPPEKFGAYMATGSKRQIEGPAVFFEVDPDSDLSAFPVEKALARCVAHADGSPRKSVYASIFNVIAQVPLTAFKKAYLTTPAGITLGLDPGEWKHESDDIFFLYQELGPVYPRAASRYEPREFCRHVTSPENMVHLPRLAFIDLKLGSFAKTPFIEGGPEIPYQYIEHLRECLRSLHQDPERATKIVNRGLRPDILFYLVRSGVFVGDATGMLYFPMPSAEVLDRDHHLWWHSAQAVRGY